MTNALPELTRRSILLLVAGAGIGLSPVGFSSDPVTGKRLFGPAMALADSGSGSGGDETDDPDEPDEPDDPEDSEDREDDDNSGSGSGGDSNTGDDDGPDDSDTGSGGHTGSGGDTGSGSGTEGGTLTGGQPGVQTGVQPIAPANGSGRNRLRNVTVRYPDGWVELILNDQYQLFDNLNRQVILRPATVEDFNRMVALRS